jgi:hypothetical protein
MAKGEQTVRTFLIHTDFRDITKYPSPAEFQMELPVALANVEGVSIRDYKFSKEYIINRNNSNINIYGRRGATSFNVTAQFTPGNYSHSITDLLNHINSKIDAALTSVHPGKIEFTVDTLTNMIKATLVSASAGDYIAIGPSSILDSLGFPEKGICLYHTTQPTGLSKTLTFYNLSTIANVPYDIWNTSDMVLRITDVEAVLADNPVVNRATAVLFSAGDNTTTLKQCLDHYMPLLQTHPRLQRLNIKILNMSGQPYDTPNATFLVRFYCKDSSSSAV